jgi:hypothetical protein
MKLKKIKFKRGSKAIKKITIKRIDPKLIWHKNKIE